MCRDPNVRKPIIIADCDGDVVNVDHNQKDLVEIGFDADFGWFMRILDGDKVDTSVQLAIKICK